MLLTTYDIVLLDEDFLSQVPWCYAIIDEAQRLKNPSSVCLKFSVFCFTNLEISQVIWGFNVWFMYLKIFLVLELVFPGLKSSEELFLLFRLFFPEIPFYTLNSWTSYNHIFPSLMMKGISGLNSTSKASARGEDFPRPYEEITTHFLINVWYLTTFILQQA